MNNKIYFSSLSLQITWCDQELQTILRWPALCGRQAVRERARPRGRRADHDVRGDESGGLHQPHPVRGADLRQVLQACHLQGGHHEERGE